MMLRRIVCTTISSINNGPTPALAESCDPDLWRYDGRDWLNRFFAAFPVPFENFRLVIAIV